MKQIAGGTTTTFTFTVLLIKKQCINFINYNIGINYWPPGTECQQETIIKAKQRMGGEEIVGKKHKYYKQLNNLHFLIFCLMLFNISGEFDCSPYLLVFRTSKCA